MKLKRLLNFSTRKKKELNSISTMTKVNTFCYIDEKKYLEIVETNLIEFRMDERVVKTTGFQYFLANYELDEV